MQCKLHLKQHMQLHAQHQLHHSLKRLLSRSRHPAIPHDVSDAFWTHVLPPNSGSSVGQGSALSTKTNDVAITSKRHSSACLPKKGPPYTFNQLKSGTLRNRGWTDQKLHLQAKSDVTRILPRAWLMCAPILTVTGIDFVLLWFCMS